MKHFKITNLMLSLLPDLLGVLTLDDKKSCARRRFFRNLNPHIEDFKQARADLQEKYGKKDGSGNFVTDKQGVIQYTPENKVLINKSWAELNDTVVTIDVLPSNEPDMLTMKQIILDEQKRFIEEKKNEFTHMDYDYSATLEEIAQAITLIDPNATDVAVDEAKE